MYSGVLQACQGFDYFNDRNSSAVPVIELLLVLVPVGPSPGIPPRLGQCYQTLVAIPKGATERARTKRQKTKEAGQKDAANALKSCNNKYYCIVMYVGLVFKFRGFQINKVEMILCDKLFFWFTFTVTSCELKKSLYNPMQFW